MSYDPFLPTLNLSALFELCSYLHALFARPDCAAVFVNCLFVSPARMVKNCKKIIQLMNLDQWSRPKASFIISIFCTRLILKKTGLQLVHKSFPGLRIWPRNTSFPFKDGEGNRAKRVACENSHSSSIQLKWCSWGHLWFTAKNSILMTQIYPASGHKR